MSCEIDPSLREQIWFVSHWRFAAIWPVSLHILKEISHFHFDGSFSERCSGHYWFQVFARAAFHTAHKAWAINKKINKWGKKKNCLTNIGMKKYVRQWPWRQSGGLTVNAAVTGEPWMGPGLIFGVKWYDNKIFLRADGWGLHFTPRPLVIVPQSPVWLIPVGY